MSLIKFNATSSPLAGGTKRGSAVLRDDLPLRTLVVNCQSIRGNGKQGLLQNLISSSKADIIIGTESWLDSSVRSSEVFPLNFKSYRKDRADGTRGGGVFILVSDIYDSCEPEGFHVENECELVWVKIKVKGASDLYVASFYKPPSVTDAGCLEKLVLYS